MGQCYARCRPPGELEGTDAFGRHREGGVYSLHNKSGPLTPEEKAIDEILGPLFELTLEARFGYQLCLHVFTALARVARLCLEDQVHDPPMAARLSRLREVAWGVEELLDNFSSRGWLLRLLCTSRLDAFVKWRLDDLAALARELLAGEQPAAEGDGGGGSTEGGAMVLHGAGAGVDTGKRLAAGLRNARRLREVVATLLPSVMAPHGGAGDPAAMENFMRRVTPLVHNGDNPLRQLELQEEVQIAVASLSVGPHRALRHPDLQYFWWRHMAGLEEVPWSTLWPHLATFLGNTPRLSDGAGDTCAALALLGSTDMVRRLQAAVHRMGYANYVNAAELDMAFGPGAGSAGCTTLDEQLRLLMVPGRPILLARTSKGARAEGWAREASAAAAARQAAAAAPIESRRATTAAAIMATRHALAVSAVAGEAGGGEGDAWFDAASNFSRATSSTYVTVMAGGDDGSGIWTGRSGVSRPHSQMLLLGGSTEMGPRASGDGSLIDPRHNPSRRESIRTSAGRDLRISGTSLYGGPQAAGGGPRQPPPNRWSIAALPPPAPSVRMSAGAGVGGAQGRPNTSTVVEDEIVPDEEERNEAAAVEEEGAERDGVAGAGADPTAPQQSQPALGTAATPVNASLETSEEEGDGSGRASTYVRKPDLLANSAVERRREQPEVEGGRGVGAALPPLTPNTGVEGARYEPPSERGGAGDTAAALVQPPPPPPFNATQQQANGASAAAGAGGAATRGLMRLVGRDEDINRLVSAIVSCGRRVTITTAGGAVPLPLPGHLSDPSAPSAQPFTAPSPFAGVTPQQPQQPLRSLVGLPSLVVVSGPCGCGKTALVTVAADRLVSTGVWSTASFADVRCAASAEDAALAMAIALNVPFYAADRPAGARLLSWLRSYGPQLKQGLVLDNVDLLLGLGSDESLEMAHSTSGAGTAAATPLTSTAGAPPSLTQGPSRPTGSSAAPAAAREAGEGGSPLEDDPTQQGLKQTSGGAAGGPLQRAADRRWRLLRLLRDVLLAAPGLRLVLVSSPAVTWDLLQTSIPQDLGVAFHGIPRMTHGAATQLLRGTLGVRATSGGAPAGEATGALMEEQMAAIVRGCDRLPALVRLAGRAVRCGTPDLTTLASWAQEALRPAGGQDRRATVDVLEAAAATPSPLATFASRLVSYAVTHLPSDARGVLCCLVSLGSPLEEEDVTAAAAFLGHPGLVRAALCCLYDVGLLTYQSLSHRHDVVTHVRQWVLRNDIVVPLPDPGLRLGGGHSSGGGSKPAGSGRRRSPRRIGGLSFGGGTSLGAGNTSAGGDGGGGTTGRATAETQSSGGGCVELTPRSGLRAITEGGVSRSSSIGGRRRRTSGRRSASVWGQCGPVAIKEPSGIRLCVLVQHLDGLLTQVGELYAHGCRVAALRLYNNGRSLADRALLLLPPWIARAGPCCPAAPAFATVLCRHLNNICRHILTPNQLARTSRDLAQLQPRLTASYDRLIAAITAARAHVHLLALPPAVQQLAAADSLAAQLYPQLAVRLDASKRSGPPQSWRGPGSSGFTSVGGATMGGPAPTSVGGATGGRRTSGGGGSGIVARASASLRGSGAWELTQLAGIPPQVSQLALAHAELAAASGQYDTATRHLEAFLELLLAAGMSQSLEGAQARMQLGDLTLRRGRPPAEAAEHYNNAATLLMQLYGQSHFRVGRAMLAAARCSVDASPAMAAAVAAAAAAAARRGEGASGGGAGWGLGAVGLSVRRRMAASAAGDVPRRPLEIQLQDCLYVQQLSQGKFNLDVAEVEVARGAVLCKRNLPDEALSCGLVALGIVLEILGDGTPQVAECLALISKALRQKHKPAAAAAVALHAHAVRLHATAVAAVATSIGGAVTAATFARPPPTEAVVLQALSDPSKLAPSAAAAVAGMAAIVSGATGTSSVSTTTVGEELSLVSGFLSQRSRQLPDGTPRRSARLMHSPVVQVPLPVGQADAGAGGIDEAEPLPAPRSKRVDLLQSSPRLVVLESGDEISTSDDGLESPSPSLSEHEEEETPELEPSSSPPLSSDVVQRDIVRHVPYGPPLVPVDSVSSGGMAGDRSPTAAATTDPPAGAAGERYDSPNIVRHVPYGPPLSRIDSVLSGGIAGDRLAVTATVAASMPGERYGGVTSTGFITGSLCVSDSPTSPSRIYGATTAPATSTTAAAPAAADSLAAFPHQPESCVQEGHDTDHRHQEQQLYEQGGGDDDDGPAPSPSAAPTKLTPEQSLGLAGTGWLPGLEAEGTALASRVTTGTGALGLPPRPPLRVACLESEGSGAIALARDSSNASDVWADAPEEFPEGAAGVGGGGCAGHDGGTADNGDGGAGGQSPLEPAVSSVALAALLTAAGLPGSRTGKGGMGGAGGGKAGREEDEVDYIGMAPSGAPPPSFPKRLLTLTPATDPPVTDGCCTPVRVRLQEPGIPHLHPSPLTHSAQRGPAVSSGVPDAGEISGGGDGPASGRTTSPPDFQLPPPPLTKAPPPSLAKTLNSSAAGHSTLLGISISANSGLGGFLSNFDPSVAGAVTGSMNGSAISDGTGTPFAQLCWSVFSPNGGRPTEDSRAIGRGGIVFPTPTSTPGVRSSTLAQRAPWLSQPAAPDSSPPQTPRRPRELNFQDTTTPSPRRRSASGAHGGGLCRVRKTTDPPSSLGRGFMGASPDVGMVAAATEMECSIHVGALFRGAADDVLVASRTEPPPSLPPRAKAAIGVAQRLTAAATALEPLDTDFTLIDTLAGCIPEPRASSPTPAPSSLGSGSMSPRRRDAAYAAGSVGSGSQRRTSSSSGAVVAVRAAAADVTAAMMALMGSLRREHGDMPLEDEVSASHASAVAKEGLGHSTTSVTAPWRQGKVSSGGGSSHTGSPRGRALGDADGQGKLARSVAAAVHARKAVSPVAAKVVTSEPGSPVRQRKIDYEQRRKSSPGGAVTAQSPAKVPKVAYGSSSVAKAIQRQEQQATSPKMAMVEPSNIPYVVPPASPRGARIPSGSFRARLQRARSEAGAELLPDTIPPESQPWVRLAARTGSPVGSRRWRSEGGGGEMAGLPVIREATSPLSPTRARSTAGTLLMGSPGSRSDCGAAVRVAPTCTREITPPASPTRARGLAGTSPLASTRSRTSLVEPPHPCEITPPSSPTRAHSTAGTPPLGLPRLRSDGDMSVKVEATRTREITPPASPTPTHSTLEVQPLQVDLGAVQLTSPGQQRHLIDRVLAAPKTFTSQSQSTPGSPTTRSASPAVVKSTPGSRRQSPLRSPRCIRPSAVVAREPQDAPPSPSLPQESIPLLPHEESVEPPRPSEVVRIELQLTKLPSLELVTVPALSTGDDLCRSTGWSGATTSDGAVVADSERLAAPVSASMMAAAAAAVADSTAAERVRATEATGASSPTVMRRASTRVLSKSEGGVPSNGPFLEVAPAASGTGSDVPADGSQPTLSGETPLAWGSTYAAPLPPLPLTSMTKAPTRVAVTAPPSPSPHPSSIAHGTPQPSPWHSLVGGNPNLASRRATAPSAPTGTSAAPSPAYSDRSHGSRIPRTAVLTSPISHSSKSGIPTPPPPQPVRLTSGHTPHAVTVTPNSSKPLQRRSPRASPSVWTRLSSRPSPPKVAAGTADAISTPTPTRIPPLPPSVRNSTPRSGWSKIPVSPSKPSASPAVSAAPKKPPNTAPAAHSKATNSAAKATVASAATSSGSKNVRPTTTAHSGTTPSAKPGVPAPTTASSSTPVAGSTPPAAQSLSSTTDTISTMTVTATGTMTPTPSAIAAWTLYASPAFGVQDTSTSPRADAEGIPLAESPPTIEAVRVAQTGCNTPPSTRASAAVITSPAARKAGSYTAAYLIQMRQHQKANPHIASKTPTSTTADPFIPTTSTPGAAVSSGGAHPPVSIHLHNPLFVSQSPQKVDNSSTERARHTSVDDSQEDLGGGVHRVFRHQTWVSGSEGGAAAGNPLGRSWRNVGLEAVGGGGLDGDTTPAVAGGSNSERSVWQSLRVRSSPSKMLNWRNQRSGQSPSPDPDAKAPQTKGQSEVRTSVIVFLRAGDRSQGALRGGSLGM